MIYDILFVALFYPIEQRRLSARLQSESSKKRSAEIKYKKLPLQRSFCECLNAGNFRQEDFICRCAQGSAETGITMNFHEFGDRSKPHIMLIHGGGNAWWNYLRQARALSGNYHVILPTLDGHGEEYGTEYISTEDSAEKLIQYIDRQCDGHLFCLGGVSLGGQIVMEMLSQRRDIAKKAIIDGSLCIPQPEMAKNCISLLKWCWGMMFGKTACSIQMGILKLFPKLRFPKEIADYYREDMPRLRRETMISIYRTYMAQYRLKDCIRETTAQISYWYGSKEMACVKASAQFFKETVPSCEIREAKGCDHGYFAIYMPEKWLEWAVPFLEK